MKKAVLFLMLTLFCCNYSVAQDRGLSINKKSKDNSDTLTASKNIALIIGTNNYTNWKGLNNPVFDAKTIKEELERKYNYEVIYLENPSKAEILKVLLSLYVRFQNNDYGDNVNFLFFLAGHGGYDDFVNGYLVPSDAKSADNDPFKESCIKHDELRSMIDNLKAKHTLVILDACFGGAFDQLISSRGDANEKYDYHLTDYSEFIHEKKAYKSRKYITSGGKEYVPDGTPGHHSPFAYKFIALLRESYDNKRMLTFHSLCSGLELVNPQPRAGEFGYNDPGSDFILLPKSINADDKKNSIPTPSNTQPPLADTISDAEQDSKPFALVSADKMSNYLYIGVPNPVTILVSGIPKSKINVSISEGEIKGSNGKYIVNVKQRGRATITITSEDEKSKIIGAYDFRVKPIPSPHIKFGSRGGGTLSAAVMKSQNRIFAVVDDFDFDVMFTVTHFSLFITKPDSKQEVFESNSNKFTPEMQSAMDGIMPGSKVVFDYIFVVGPDSLKRALDPIEFTCN